MMKVRDIETKGGTMGKIVHLQRTQSTQHDARRLLERGEVGLGDAVIADEQTAGRGRFGRSWVSPRGGLYATIITPSDPLISLKAGLALSRVLNSAGVAAVLKWPNDVLVGSRKLAGILVEAIDECCLVGVGINVASSPIEAATHMAAHGLDVQRDALAKQLIRELMIEASGELDLDAYRSCCLTLGQVVRIENAGARLPIEGIATDIDSCGRLVVATREGHEVISSGECVHLRTQSATMDRS